MSVIDEVLESFMIFETLPNSQSEGRSRTGIKNESEGCSKDLINSATIFEMIKTIGLD